MSEALFSVVLHKATLKPKCVASGLTLAAANARATELYEESKLFFQHGSLATGVALFVFPDSSIDALLNKYDFRLLKGAVLQCGGW